ncbi:glycosyltransferase involved in cell wall biosynthesis [Leeuwenhoekiella aestuarii]|uniref:glycosyltransferase family 2 protein n=1 Tax=Leeuwenhoekiella aestuarii TaxID=2249426 RepID=UPI000FFF184A|nr:glycosyltransferase family A protein [Leeuwenhoekiella aestuarii]RXG13761.1 glycosyltransferase involved in cell wall biosynthesis [Leeuwenhoekiella aestuarii]
MISDAKFSIIIPVYNGEKYLKETLLSIQRQSYSNWECIVVDDGSTDSSVTIAEHIAFYDGRFKIFQRPNSLPKGANSCRNFGFDQISGAIVNWFDADDYMLPQFIETKIHAFKNDVQLVISSGFFTNELLENKKPMQVFKTQELYTDYFLWNLKLITGSVAFKRDFLNGRSLFDNTLKKSQEFEFFTRLFVDISPKAYSIIETELFLYRSHPSSKTSLNQGYNQAFKESEAFAILVNLERSVRISNIKVANSAYRLLINLLHKAIANNHSSNVEVIYRGLKDNLKATRRGKMASHILGIMINSNKLFDINFLPWDKLLKKLNVY